MLNIQQLIQDTLSSYWTEIRPALTDFSFTQDELDPKWGEQTSGPVHIQVLLENFPSRKTFIASTSSGALYRIDHACRITVFLRLISYQIDKVSEAKDIFFNLRSEIDRILTDRKFSIAGITNLEMTMQGWNDRATIAVGRGIKTKREPIVWQSEKLVTAVYYIHG